MHRIDLGSDVDLCGQIAVVAGRVIATRIQRLGRARRGWDGLNESESSP
jgi:hypothetical protein